MKYKSKISAIKNLKVFFKNKPEADVVTLEEIYVAYGRDLTKTEGNKSWIANLLTHIKYNGLVTTVYSNTTGKRVLSGVRLTIEGKRSLGRIQADEPVENGTTVKEVDKASIGSGPVLDILRQISKLKTDYPDFEITFDVKLKGV